MLDFETFKNDLMACVEDELCNRHIKNVSLKFDSIDAPDGQNERMIASVGDSKMSMAFRLREIYKGCDEGEDMDHAVNRICNTIEEGIVVCKTKVSSVTNFVTDYNNVKEHTYLRMIPGDSPVLSNTPHRMIEDMALVVNIHLESLFDDEVGRSVVVVSEPLLDMYGIDETQLFADAEKNSFEHEPVVFTALGSMIQNLLKAENLPSPEEEGIVSYVASNKSGFYGASVIGYPDFFEKAEDVIGGSYYIIPSSVHEFILIKDDGTPKAKDLNKMIENVNETVLMPRDYLSNQCYHYDAKTKTFETGLEYNSKKQKAGRLAS